MKGVDFVVAAIVVVSPSIFLTSAAAPIPGSRQHNDSLWSELVAAEDARAETPEQLNTLMRATRFEDWTIRRMAVRALGRLERADLVQSIVPLLTDDSSGVRAEAANALGQAVFRGGVSPPAMCFWLIRTRKEDKFGPTIRRNPCLGRLGEVAHPDLIPSLPAVP